MPHIRPFLVVNLVVIPTTILALIGLFTVAHAADPLAAAPGAGRPVPNLCFTDHSDQPLCLSQWRGRAVLLNLWATWCVPCGKEMPQLDRLQARFGSPAFEVVALSVDRRGAPAVMHYFNRNSLHHLAVYVDVEVRATENLSARGIPISLLIDRNGRIVERIRGAIDWESPDRLALIRQLIGP